jgi:hypothetical protein
MENLSKFKDKLQDTLTWWLGKRKPFIINDEYEIKLLFIDKINNSAKIEITNLKSKSVETMEVSSGQ